MALLGFPSAASLDGAARRALVVLGMHRSGTSAVAGSLHRLGVDFGSRLMPATSANERGYYEHIDIVNLHDRLLLALDSSWDETLSLPEDWWLDDARTGSYRAELLALIQRDFSESSFWGLKDPRLCRMLPWWEPIWRTANVTPLYLIVLRDPRAIVASLVRRESFSAAKSLLLWVQHLIEAERWTRNQPRAFLDFEDFLSDPILALTAVSEKLGCIWPVGVGELQTESEPFLDKSLRQVPSAQADTPLPRWVERMDKALRLSLQGKAHEPAMMAALDLAREQLHDLTGLYDPMMRQRATDLDLQLSVTRRQSQWYEREWSKANSRAKDLETKLWRAKEREKSLRQHIIEKEKYISKLRNKNVSIMIKLHSSGLVSRIKKSVKIWLSGNSR